MHHCKNFVFVKILNLLINREKQFKSKNNLNDPFYLHTHFYRFKRPIGPFIELKNSFVSAESKNHNVFICSLNILSTDQLNQAFDSFEF